MDDKDLLTVPYVVYESEMSRSERTIKRLFLLLIFSLLVILGTNGVWIWLWNQYDYVSTEDTVDMRNIGGNMNYIGNDGDIK